MPTETREMVSFSTKPIEIKGMILPIFGFIKKDKVTMLHIFKKPITVS